MAGDIPAGGAGCNLRLRKFRRATAKSVNSGNARFIYSHFLISISAISVARRCTAWVRASWYDRPGMHAFSDDENIAGGRRND